MGMYWPCILVPALQSVACKFCDFFFFFNIKEIVRVMFYMTLVFRCWQDLFVIQTKRGLYAATLMPERILVFITTFEKMESRTTKQRPRLWLRVCRLEAASRGKGNVKLTFACCFPQEAPFKVGLCT